jgi:hypothetical protein
VHQTRAGNALFGESSKDRQFDRSLHTGCLDSATFCIWYLTDLLDICSDSCSWYGFCRFVNPVLYCQAIPHWQALVVLVYWHFS